MEKQETVIDYELILSKLKKFFIQKLGKDFNGEVIEVVESIIDVAKLYTDGEGYEVAGDGAAVGTSICTLSIPDEAVFICTKAKFSTNVGALAYIGTGALADPPTKYYFLDCQAAGEIIEFADDTGPLFVINNIGGTGALTLRMYAPQTAKGVATNNDITHYFDGYMGGILLT